MRKIKKYLSSYKHIRKFQISCGAVKTFFHDEKKTRELYGLSEVDVIHKDSDSITDQLYVNGILTLCLHTAYKATGNKEYRDFFHQIMDFLAGIQIKSKDKRLNGAWMRAFDYKNWEYYGSNGDVDWGPYCVESGWTNAWIAVTLSLYLQDEILI